LNVVAENPFRAVEHIILEVGINVAKRTVIRRLKANGLISCRPTRKCVLTEEHRQERLAFANRHLNKPQEEWDK
jgi:Mn-dependent DtxR family transcriptional regulator